MRNVYLINLSFGLAGIERRFANLLKVLSRRGVVFPILVIPSALASILREANLLPAEPCSVIVISEPKPLLWLGRLRFPQILHIPFAIFRSRIAALGYRKVWKKIEQDPGAIVHIGMNCSALRPPHVPTVYECVDSTLKQIGTRHFRRASSRRCIVHCQTDRIRSALDAIFADQAPRWRTITNPTYFASYNDSPRMEVRDPRLVAFVGRMDSEKNPLLFIKAIARVRQKGHDCRAIMLGEGPLRSEVDALIRRSGLEGFVAVNFHSKPTDILRRAAMYVSLQTFDNFGSQSLLEAMGAGCAIIASDVGETRMIVTEDVGLRVALTIDSLAAAIESLTVSPESARQLGERAKQVARSKYSADVYASFLESIYDLAKEHHMKEVVN